MKGESIEREYEATTQEADAIREAANQKADEDYEAAWLEAKAIRGTLNHDASAVLYETYLSIYADGGGMQSQVAEIIVKLITRERELCKVHYGL